MIMEAYRFNVNNAILIEVGPPMDVSLRLAKCKMDRIEDSLTCLYGLHDLVFRTGLMIVDNQHVLPSS